MDPMVIQSLQLMLYGISGVFISLAILWATVKIVSAIFPHKKDSESSEEQE